MKTCRLGWMVVVAAALVGSQLATAETPQPQPQPPGGTTSKPSGTPAPVVQDAATLKDIESTFGFVPQFLKAIPPELRPAVWHSLKSLQLNTETKLDRKTKELIGLAVSAQIPCEYCIMFHTEAAKLNGASEQEIHEAVGMAALTREMSTLLNGLMVDKAQFKRDLDRIVRTSRQQARK